MTKQQTLSTRTWLELLALALIWGGSFPANRQALAELPVFSIVAIRVVGGMLVLWLYIWIRRVAVPRSPRLWLAYMIMGLLNNVVPFSLIVWGQQHIEGGLAAILNAATAIFGIVVAALVFGDEPLTLQRGAGVVLGFCGVVMVVGLQALTRFDISSLAQLAVLAASLSYACASSFGRAMFGGVAPQVTAAAMLTCSAVVMVPLALATDGWPSLPFTAPTWGALAYLAILSAALAYLLYYRVLAAAGAGNLTLVTLLVAPFAIVMGALRFGESLTWQAYGGFAVLAVGLLVMDGRAVTALRRRLS